MIRRQSPSGKAIRSWEGGFLSTDFQDPVIFAATLPYLLRPGPSQVQMFAVFDVDLAVGDTVQVTLTDMATSTLLANTTFTSATGPGNQLLVVPMLDVVDTAAEVAAAVGATYNPGNGGNAVNVAIVVIAHAFAMIPELDSIE